MSSTKITADLQLEFEAAMVLPEITRNYVNYHYDNYVGNVPRR